MILVHVPSYDLVVHFKFLEFVDPTWGKWPSFFPGPTTENSLQLF